MINLIINIFYPSARSTWLAIAVSTALILSACQPQVVSISSGASAFGEDQLQNPETVSFAQESSSDQSPVTTFPKRPRYSPGQLVDYTAQPGDTLPFLAVRFNTTVEGILEANPFIPQSATTMPPGMPMQIPIYYLPLWGSPYQMIPDSLFVNGPNQVNFNTKEFVAQNPGWLKNYKSFAGRANRSGAEIVDLVARNYSVSPLLLLALLEYQAEALSQPIMSTEVEDFPLGNRDWEYKGLYLQLTWAANLLNNGYYNYRLSKLISLEFRDGRMERFDPWQNAATVSLQNYFNTIFEYNDFVRAIAPEGIAQTYKDLFGDPWDNVQPHIPGSLTQPQFILPFEPGEVWALTGGPHAGYGRGEPFAALDFAPPSVSFGCIPSAIFTTAVAPGIVVRSEYGQVMLDLDGDGDERTGWNVFYLHVATKDRVPLGTTLQQGDRIGHPSCEGGRSTGTHIHIARKFNGEWMPAEDVMGYNLEGWTAHNGSQPYLGTLTRGSLTVTACTCSNAASFIKSDRLVPAGEQDQKPEDDK